MVLGAAIGGPGGALGLLVIILALAGLFIFATEHRSAARLPARRKLGGIVRAAAPKIVEDNYEDFIERLNTAADNLTARRDALLQVQSVVTTAFEFNHTGLDIWSLRRARGEALLADQAVNPASQTALKELQEVAIDMEATFRTRSERVRERVRVIHARFDQIDSSLLDLEKSRVKLKSSRMLAQERANLSRAVVDLAGTPDTVAVVSPDGGLRHDLKQAREAVILAEALMEVKG